MIDYFSQNLWQAWALIALVCLILELTNGDFFIMSFAIGCVFGALAAAIGLGGVAQIIVFAVFTVLSLLVVRPIALRYFHRGEDKRESNAEALIGRIGLVTDAIPANGYGRVKIDGDSWKAKSGNGEAIEAGKHARVMKLESIIATVEETEESNN